ncbi:hypothetical protein N8510_02075 [bacterium]|nr:hypothetical protein [bacterium]
MLRADVQASFFRRYLWIAVACVGCIGWCVFDIQVTYPGKLVIVEAYESLPDTLEREGTWIQLAEEKGWSTDTPAKSSSEIKGQVLSQYIMIVISGVVGFVMLLTWILSRRLWIEGDETQFSNSRGKTVFLDELQSIDVNQWEEKGIAVLRFNGDKGRGRFVLDSFKFNQQVTEQLFEIAREKLYVTQSGGESLEPHNDVAG